MVSSEILQAWLHGFEKSGSFSGTALIAHHGEPVLLEAVGVANREHNLLNSTASRYRIASLSKAFTAAAILLLKEQGKLDIYEDIREYFPGQFKWDTPITLHHLLTHTSGIPDIYTASGFTGHLEKLSYTEQEFLDLFRHKELEFSPGSRWKYGNCGYTLLAGIIEQVSGMSYEAFLQKNIWEPLGMKHTCCDTNVSVIPFRSEGYSFKDGNIQQAAYYDMGTVKGSGDLISTVEDLLKWDQALYTEQILSRDSLSLMFALHAAPDQDRHYGYGWSIYEKYQGHGGWLPGYWSKYRRYPGSKWTILLLSNHDFVRESGALQQLEFLLEHK